MTQPKVLIKRNQNYLFIHSIFLFIFSSEATLCYLCPSICPSVFPYIKFRGNAIFSAHNCDRVLIFCGHISHIHEHLFDKYFVRRFVNQASKGKNVKTCKCDFLDILLNFLQFIHIFLIISNSFSTYGCCHPCFASNICANY